MCVAVIGGMDRLAHDYVTEAAKLGVEPKAFTKVVRGMSGRVGDVDGIIVFTKKVSHSARSEVLAVAHSRRISLQLSDSCGVCALRNCLSWLSGKGKEGKIS